MRWLICALVFSMFASAPALADPPADEPNAAPASIGLDMIAEARADGVFELIPTEHLVGVRHARSGLVCRMDPANTNRLIIFPRAARGEDVACESVGARESITFYATRFPVATNLQEQMTVAAAAIRHRYPDAQACASIADEAASAGLPAYRSVAFMVAGADGARMYTRATIALLNGWAFKLRYTVLAPDDAAVQRAERSANLIWRAALTEIASPAGA
jgi:hypothetical protein